MLLITLTTLFLALMGFALFSSSQSKVNADETLYTETLEDFLKDGSTYRWNDVIDCSLLNQEDSRGHYVLHLGGAQLLYNSGAYVSIVFYDIDDKGSYIATSQASSTNGTVFAERIEPYSDYKVSVKEAFKEFVYVNDSGVGYLSIEALGCSLSNSTVYNWLRQNAIRVQKLTVKSGETVLDEFEIAADTSYRFGDFLAEQSLLGYDSDKYVFTDSTGAVYSAETSFRTSEDLTIYVALKPTVNVMYGNQIIKSYTVEQGSIITADTLRKDLARDGYELVGLSYTADGEAAQLTDLTVTSDLTLYAVYNKTDDVEESNFGDKISDFANNVSDWLKDNTGMAVSSGSLIVAAIVIVLIMLTKRK